MSQDRSGPEYFQGVPGAQGERWVFDSRRSICKAESGELAARIVKALESTRWRDPKEEKPRKGMCALVLLSSGMIGASVATWDGEAFNWTSNNFRAVDAVKYIPLEGLV